jgi:hypothetical protein
MSLIRSPRLPILAAMLLMAACTPIPDRPPHGPVTMPADATPIARDPMRTAITEAAFAFQSSGNLAGRPADAARAVAQYEFITAELPYTPRWRDQGGGGGVSGPALMAALPELRGTVGIAPNAPAQQVVDSLFAAARALRAGDRAAAERVLSTPHFTRGGAGTLQVLTELPAMPQVSTAVGRAAAELDRPSGRDGGSGGVFR